MENESVFVPISFEDYRNNKIRGLKIQLLIKRNLILTQQIEETKKIKDLYKKQLLKTLIELKKEVEKFNQRLPKNKQITKSEISVVGTKKISTKIDEELESIQEKLKQLYI